MINPVIKQACHDFAAVAAPYLNICHQEHYDEALVLIEELLEEAEGSLNDPINVVIELISHAIEAFENKDEELAEFKIKATGQSFLKTKQHRVSDKELDEMKKSGRK